MERLPDWEDRLNGWIADCSDAYFQWGKLDCLMFVAGGIEAVTGVDHGEPHRGKYRTATGAMKHLKTLGFDSAEDFLNANFPACPPALAQRGDIVLSEDCAGICVGPEALFIGEDDGAPGLIRKPFAAWTAAWKIG